MIIIVDVHTLFNIERGCSFFGSRFCTIMPKHGERWNFTGKHLAVRSLLVLKTFIRISMQRVIVFSSLWSGKFKPFTLIT